MGRHSLPRIINTSNKLCKYETDETDETLFYTFYNSLRKYEKEKILRKKIGNKKKYKKECFISFINAK